MPTNSTPRMRPFSAGIGHEALAQLLGLTVEDDGEQDGEDDEQAHPPEEDLRVGELSLVVVAVALPLLLESVGVGVAGSRLTEY